MVAMFTSPRLMVATFLLWMRKVAQLHSQSARWRWLAQLGIGYIEIMLPSAAIG